jgi:hypothetical protein
MGYISATLGSATIPGGVFVPSTNGDLTYRGMTLPPNTNLYVSPTSYPRPSVFSIEEQETEQDLV